ncbi:hypothetical protein GW590_06245 [Rahnella sp. SAP-1]|jgi:hypothetical protein|uniref:Uncharacterized protein n=1 Tax=Rouxiella aceris TaxID=2703884 RepID=A0A848MEA3_9GAMM|nr:hypothetical protein [Rouxiella aceris]NMP26467.1 hypothetical protein [Rouxiella aceris]
MYIPTTYQRRQAFDSGRESEHQASDEQDKRRFAALLAIPAAVENRGYSLSDERAGQRAQCEEGSDTRLLQQLFRQPSAATAWLQWRLTNGPLAGLEIAACCIGDELHLRLKSQDLQKLHQALGSARQLQQQLSQQFSRQVMVEVSDVHPAVE